MHSIHTAHALITAETQRADGLTVRGNWGREKNEESDRGGGEGGEGRDWEAEGVCRTYTDRLRHTEWGRGSSQHLRGSSFISVRRRVSHGQPHQDSCRQTACGAARGGYSGGGERGWGLSEKDEKHRHHLTHTGSQPWHLQRQSEHSGYQGDWGRLGERAAEIMRGAESSCGFPIFGNGSSSRRSRSCGSTDSSRASWSCSKTRSPHSKAIYLSRDESSIYSQGVTGTSCRCCHSVECTCSQSSDGSCSAGVEVTTAAQLGVVVAVAGGGSGSGHWMTSVADEGHLDPPAETSQGRSRQELWCLCKHFKCVYNVSVFLCACACVCVVQ